MNDPKFCVNCKFHIMPYGDGKVSLEAHGCTAPHEVNLVTGQREYDSAKKCTWMREKGNTCGPDGKLFEPKP